MSLYTATLLLGTGLAFKVSCNDRRHEFHDHNKRKGHHAYWWIQLRDLAARSVSGRRRFQLPKLSETANALQ